MAAADTLRPPYSNSAPAYRAVRIPKLILGADAISLVEAIRLPPVDCGDVPLEFATDGGRGQLSLVNASLFIKALLHLGHPCFGSSWWAAIITAMVEATSVFGKRSMTLRSL